MPKKLEDCVSKVKGQGKPESNAYAICNASMGKKSSKYSRMASKLKARQGY